MFATIVSRIALAFAIVALPALGQTKINLGNQAIGGASLGTGLIISNGTSALTAYAGTSCTNQFPRSLNASGAATCASVANTDLTNSSMTIAGHAVSLGGTQTLACSDLTGVAASCATDATNASNIGSGTLPVARLSLSKITNSISGDVSLNNTANYFDGPSVAQGSTGTWCAWGTVTLTDNSAVNGMFVKLWDGTTVIASAVAVVPAAGNAVAVSLSGCLASPAANLRISARAASATTGLMKFNLSGLSMDSTITAFRIQ